MIKRFVVKVTIEETEIVLERGVNEAIVKFNGLDGRLDYFCRII